MKLTRSPVKLVGLACSIATAAGILGCNEAKKGSNKSMELDTPNGAADVLFTSGGKKIFRYSEYSSSGSTATKHVAVDSSNGSRALVLSFDEKNEFVELLWQSPGATEGSEPNFQSFKVDGDGRLVPSETK